MNSTTQALEAALKAKQALAIKACEMKDIRQQVKLAKQALAEVTRKAKQPAPAPKSVLDTFNSLSGEEATRFYRKHRSAIIAAQDSTLIK